MKNILFKISHTSEDESVKYELVYIVGRKLRGRKGDKTYPKVTQCLLFYNGLLKTFGEVVKCDDDKDNMEYALKAVTKKVMGEVWFKDLRKPLWDKLNLQIQAIAH